MPESGMYSEKLPCGGTLEVTDDGFRIRYYFAGPDARSRGTFVDIDGSSLPDYITAYRENLEQYQTLKKVIPEGGDFQHPGKLGMQIRIGSFNEGVCIQSYHMPLNTAREVEKVIASYEYAIKRAARARAMLREM